MTKQQRGRRRLYASIFLESLEPRTLLSTFVTGDRILATGATPCLDAPSADGQLYTTLSSGALGTVGQVGPTEGTSQWYLIDWDNFSGPQSDGWSDDTTLDLAPTDAAPAPAIASISPSSVPALFGNQPITINGSNFVNGATLSFLPPQGGAPLPSTAAKLTFVSPSQINYQMNNNNNPGTWSIRVNNPDGQSSAYATLTVTSTLPAPSVSSVSPTSMPAANKSQTLTINGANFQSGATLAFTSPQGGAPILSTASKLTVVSSSKITYQFNNNTIAGTWSVQVTNPDGQSSAGATFTVTSAIQAPSISALAPTSMPASNSDQTLTINGANFQSGATLSFLSPQGGSPIPSTAANLTFVNASQITYQFNNASNAGTWSVRVNNPDGQISSYATFIVTPAIPPPSISALAPTSMPASNSNQTLTINGANFQSGATLSFLAPQGGTPIASAAANLTFINNSQINYQFNNNNNAGTWSVRVNNPDGQSSSYAAFTVKAVIPPPGISAVSPASFVAANNQTLTINGANFQNGATLTFQSPQGGSPIASTAANLTFINASQINFQFSNTTTGTWRVHVTNPDGQSSADASFTVTAPTPPPPPPPPPPTTAVNDYPAALANAPLDSITDPWGLPNRECHSYVAWRINRDHGTTSAPYYFTNTMTGPNGVRATFGDANFWADVAARIGFTVDHTPSVGSIAQWSTLQHVAYVESVNSNGTVNISEYNFIPGQWDQRFNITAEAYIHFNTPTAPINGTPFGWIDVASRQAIVGWAFDPNSGAAPAQARIDIDGVVGTPFSATLSRADLTAVAAIGSPNHGFSRPLGSLSNASHTVALFVRNNATGLFKQVASATIPPFAGSTDKLPLGWIDIANHQVIAGWAFDPDRGASPVQARIDIDGNTGVAFTANGVRPDLATAPAIGSPDHGFSQPLSVVSAAAHSVVLFVQDSADGIFKPVASAYIPAVTASDPGGSNTQLHPKPGDPLSFFDATYYLAHNPDVAAAVAKGTIASAWAHFQLYGQFERRRPSTLFDESYYLTANPDVASAVINKIFVSGFQHFVYFGFSEGRHGTA